MTNPFATTRSPNYVRMSYRTDGKQPKSKELPFVIGVIVALAGMPEEPSVPVEDRPFLAIDASNFDRAMQEMGPRLALRVANKLTDDGTWLNIEFRFRRLADFSPANIALQVAPLAKLLELRTQLRRLLQTVEIDEDLGKALDEALADPARFGRLKQEIDEAEPSQAPCSEPAVTRPEDEGSWSMQAQPHVSQHSVLDEIIESGRSIATRQAHDSTRDAVRAFVQQLVVEDTPASVTPAEIKMRVAEVDHLMSDQLAEIMHRPEFQRLEASWRGLRHLVWTTRKAPSVKLRVLNVSKKELLENFRRASGSKQSALARRIRAEEFETLGGEPYGLLIADFEFGPEPEDQELLEGFSRVGASAHVPFLAAPAPSLLGVHHFGELAGAFNLPNVQSREEYVHWCAFQNSQRSRYIGLALPRVLLRNRYGRAGRRLQEFDFEERGSDDRTTYLWGNAAWALASRLAKDFERYGWFGGPRDACDTGVISGLPAYSTWCGTEAVTVGPVEASVDEEQATRLNAAGFIALRQAKGVPGAQFSGTWSCHLPAASEDCQGGDSDDRAVEIETLMTACRLAHYVRAITKEHRDWFRSRTSCETWIRRWTADYVVPAYMRDSPQSERFPLQGAEVSIIGSAKSDEHCVVRLALHLRAQAAPLDLTIPIFLPRAIPSAVGTESTTAERSLITTPTEAPSGREQFLNALFVAEQHLRFGRIEVATAILEGLDEQVERFRLVEWESPKLTTTLWAMLRQCYASIQTTEHTIRRSAELLRRYCAVDPAGPPE